MFKTGPGGCHAATEEPAILASGNSANQSLQGVTLPSRVQTRPGERVQHELARRRVAEQAGNSESRGAWPSVRQEFARRHVDEQRADMVLPTFFF